MITRGRPIKIDKSKVIELLTNYKSQIILNNGKVISKCDEIWSTLSKQIDNLMTPIALYTFVSCNRYNIREILTNSFSSDERNENNNSMRSEGSETSRNDHHRKSCINESSTSQDESFTPQKSTKTIFTINIPKSDFQSMIIYKKYRRMDKRNRNKIVRQHMVLQSGMWQHVLCQKIWEATKLSCGFNFKNHKLTSNGQSGYANGSCRCGSVIKCKIDNSDENDISTKITCRFTEGNGRCGKRYLRKPIRETVVENMRGKSAMAYRVEMAEQYMAHNDDVEPPHLYSAQVLRTAKHEILKKKYIHEDPIKALHIMKFNKLAGIIHNIGLDPFHIHYWGNYQLDVYRAYAASEPACVYIDATGSIVKKFRKPDNSYSKHIFLYNCVINCDRVGLYPVAQMLSESHNTNFIQFWLIEWIRSGAPSSGSNL